MSKPFSENVAISNLADAAMLQGDVVVDSGQKTTIAASDETDPTPKVTSSNLEATYASSFEGCYAVFNKRANATRTSLESFL